MSSRNPRRRGPWILAGSLLVVASIVTSAWLRRPRGPDVAIIVIDTLRPDHLGCYGYGRDTSPHMDAFAAESVVFETAESAAPWTAPSMISLVTSLHPEVHGVFRFPNPGRLNERVRTLPELLKARGYATAMFTEGGYAKAEFGLDQGVDVFPSNEGDEDSHMSNMEHESRIEANVDRALAWWSSQSGSRFMLFHTYEVHAPLRAPDEHVQLFRPGWNAEQEDRLLEDVFERFEAGEPLDAADVIRVLNHRHHCSAEMPSGFQKEASERGLFPQESGLNQATLDFYRDMYDAEVHFTDEQLARLLEAFDEETLVVILSDHGEAIGEHEVLGHGSNFHREQVGIPLIVRAPGIPPRRVPDLVRSVDVMPTVLELAGAKPKDLILQGESLVPLMTGTSDSRPSFTHGLTFGGHEDRQHSLRLGSLRAVLDEDSETPRLYDTTPDPTETSDLAPDRPDLAKTLADLIRSQQSIDSNLADLLSGDVSLVEMDEDLATRLRELGYIGDD